MFTYTSFFGYELTIFGVALITSHRFYYVLIIFFKTKIKIKNSFFIMKVNHLHTSLFILYICYLRQFVLNIENTCYYLVGFQQQKY